MPNIAFERRDDGSLHYFVDARHYSLAPNAHRWRKHSLSGKRAHASDHRNQWLKQLYKHRDEVTQVRRNPRLSADDIISHDNCARLDDLASEATDLIERGRPANIKLGRIFNEIKGLLKHGEWKLYFGKTFAPRGISLRTATDYMKFAHEENALTKEANSALFPEVTDDLKRDTDKTDADGKAAVRAAGGAQADSGENKITRQQRKNPPRRDGIYHFPLQMTGSQKDATDVLLQSRKLAKVQRRMMEVLDRVLRKYGFLKNSPVKSSDEKAAA